MFLVLITNILMGIAYLFLSQTALSAAESIRVPEGFKIEEYATDLGSPRFMALSPDDVLFVTDIKGGRVLALPDQDGEGLKDSINIFVKDLNRPHGIAFHNGYLYVGETNQIIRFKYNGIDKEPGKIEIIVPDIPTNGHFTRTVLFGPDGKMYVSIGSSCNECVEGDATRATIMRFNPDGSNGEIYATGLRNSVGLTWHPRTDELWATDNGRDWLGDNLPPDEVNVIKQKKDYGWPYCYGDKVPDPEFSDPDRCEDTVSPVIEIQAHSAPLGLTFYNGKMFPTEYQGDLFIALHGSWNRSKPTGYKVVRGKIENGKVSDINDFAFGWLAGSKKTGRPVDVLVGKNGELYISDDYGGRIYKVTSNTNIPPSQ